MSFLDRFRRQHVSQSGPELRDALIAAVAAKDTPAFTALINSNAAAVRQSFAAWLTCPPDIAADPPAMQRYASGLMVIATVFQQSGDASLMAMLTQPEDNPITTWDRDMQSADTLVSAGQPTQAVELLERTLRSMEGLRGSGVDQYRPRVLGRLGIALYRAGEQKTGHRGDAAGARAL
jgi:hypothetical protein